MSQTIPVSTQDEKPPGQGRGSVDENLKKIYEELVEDEIPDRFADLLRQLREAEERK